MQPSRIQTCLRVDPVSRAAANSHVCVFPRSRVFGVTHDPGGGRRSEAASHLRLSAALVRCACPLRLSAEHSAAPSSTHSTQAAA